MLIYPSVGVNLPVVIDDTEKDRHRVSKDFMNNLVVKFAILVDMAFMDEKSPVASAIVPIVEVFLHVLLIAHFTFTVFFLVPADITILSIRTQPTVECVLNILVKRV
jgi:hypothetical protein